MTPTAYQLACGHVEQSRIGSIRIELSRVPSGKSYNVTVFHSGRGEYMGSYISTRVDVARRWYRLAVAQVRAGKWY